MFDNGSTPPKEKQSRGVLLKPDYGAKTVALAKALTNPTKTLLAPAQGNICRCPGGNWLMGYGNLPNFTEYDSAGHVLLDGTLGHNVQDFRTYLAPWSGQPETSPPLAAKRSGSSVTVSTSWNGATGVASWQVFGGSSPTLLAPVTTVPKSGFQTTGDREHERFLHRDQRTRRKRQRAWHLSRDHVRERPHDAAPHASAMVWAVSENFSLIVMCVFMLASLAFLAQQILAYH